MYFQPHTKLTRQNAHQFLGVPIPISTVWNHIQQAGGNIAKGATGQHEVTVAELDRVRHDIWKRWYDEHGHEVTE